MRAICLLLSFLAVLVSTGCTYDRRDTISNFPYYSNPQVRNAQRIVMLPFHRSEAAGRSSRALDEALANAFRELGLFEVIVLNEEDRATYLPGDVLKSSSVPSEGLRRLRVDFRADAVLLGRIESFQSYDPCATGVEAALVDCGDGTILWTGSGHFDSQRSDVQADIRAWYGSTIGKANQSISGWRATMQSPRLFSRYVADRLAHTVLGAPKLTRKQQESLTNSRGPSAVGR